MNPASLLAPASRGQVLGALYAAAWADGELQPYEMEVILGAVAALSPDEPRSAVLERMRSGTSQPPPLDGVSPGERYVAFALAAWVVVADARETDDELRFLDELRRGSGIEPEVAARLLELARWVQRQRPVHVSSYQATAVLMVECLNVLARIDGAWPPPRDPFARLRKGWVVAERQ